MTSIGKTPAQEALLREIAEKRKTDPLIGAKLGASEVFSKLTQSMKSERGVHIESLLCALGSLAGYACQASAQARGIRLATIDGADGKRYFFGDELNKPLAEDQYSVWGIAAGGAQSVGCQSLPDIGEIFRHVSKTVGGSEFGIPRTPPQHKPKYLPINSLKATWPTYLPLVKSFCASPAEWPILFAIALQQAITAGKEIIDPAEALRLAMECAIPMSKVDLDALDKASTVKVQSRLPAQQARPADERVVKTGGANKTSNIIAVREESDDDEAQQASEKSRIIAFACLALVVLPIAYYIVFVASFVPSEQWFLVSNFVGAGASLALTVILAIGMFRNNVFARFSTAHVAVCLGLTFAIFWWLFYKTCCYGVGDVAARSMGEPMRVDATAYKYDSRDRWGCSPRLTGRELGRGKCISRLVYATLPRMGVPVSIQGRKLWLGYAVVDIDIEVPVKPPIR